MTGRVTRWGLGGLLALGLVGWLLARPSPPAPSAVGPAEPARAALPEDVAAPSGAAPSAPGAPEAPAPGAPRDRVARDIALRSLDQARAGVAKIAGLTSDPETIKALRARDPIWDGLERDLVEGRIGSTTARVDIVDAFTALVDEVRPLLVGVEDADAVLDAIVLERPNDGAVEIYADGTRWGVPLGEDAPAPGD